MLAQLLSLDALAALLNFAQWSRMRPIFFCATCMDGTPELSGAFTTSLLKAPPRSPDGHQGRSPKSRVGFPRMKSQEADLWWQQASAALTWRDTPRHGWASHGADAFQVMATLFRAIEPAAPPKPKHNRVVLMVDKHGVPTRSRRNPHHRDEYLRAYNAWVARAQANKAGSGRATSGTCIPHRSRGD